MCLNASWHGVLTLVLAEVTVTNDIPKCYFRESSVTPKVQHNVHTCIHIDCVADPD